MARKAGGRVVKIGVNTLFHVPGDIGGTETYLIETLKEMVAGWPEHRFLFFTSLSNDQQLRRLFADQPHVAFNRLAFAAANRPLRILAEQLWLPLVVWRRSPDVLWSPGYTAPCWAGCPQVVTIHDLQYKNHPEDMSWLEKATLDVLVRIACRRSTRIIAVSNFSKKEIVRFGFARESKVVAIPEGVDASFSTPVTDSQTLAEFAQLVPRERPYILCVAHSYPHKNVGLLVEAFARIADKIPHTLVIVGKERRGEERVRAAERSGVAPERLVRCKDGVNFTLLKLLYQRAALFVLPSAYEGFGLPVLEAMMAGAPVLTSNRASLPEVAGEHAFYVETLDEQGLSSKMLAILNRTFDGPVPDRLAARSWAGKFTWRRGAEQTMAVLHQAAAKGDIRP